MSSTASADDAPEGDSPGVDPDLRAARRTLAFFGIAVAAAIAGSVVVVVGDRDTARSTVDGEASSVEETVAAATIGPAPATNVDRYVEDRAAALRAVEGRRVAVVSLSGYSTVDTADDLLEGVALERHLIALVGGQPRATSDVDAEIAEAVDDAEQQLADLREIAPTVEDDPDYEQFYAAEIERYERLLAAADRGDVVFGMVVTGSAADLRALGSRASVRLVDVGTSDRLDDDAVVRGLRPEETSVTGRPAERP